MIDLCEFDQTRCRPWPCSWKSVFFFLNILVVSTVHKGGFVLKRFFFCKMSIFSRPFPLLLSHPSCHLLLHSYGHEWDVMMFSVVTSKDFFLLMGSGDGRRERTTGEMGLWIVALTSKSELDNFHNTKTFHELSKSSLTGTAGNLVKLENILSNSVVCSQMRVTILMLRRRTRTQPQNRAITSFRLHIYINICVNVFADSFRSAPIRFQLSKPSSYHNTLLILLRLGQKKTSGEEITHTSATMFLGSRVARHTIISKTTQTPMKCTSSRSFACMMTHAHQSLHVLPR